jgi:adenylate cyclase
MNWLWRRVKRLARRFGFARALCVLLLIGLITLRIADPPPVEEVRLRTFDTLQRFDPRIKTARPVRIIDIDERSLAKYGQWPWPRTRIAALVSELTRLNAAVIAFDIVFSEPDRLTPGVAADTFQGLDDTTRDKLRSLPSNDRVFADAMRRSRVVLAESGVPLAVPKPEVELPQTALAMLGGEPQPFLLDFPGLLRNIPILEDAAAGRGLVSINPERDGIIRRIPMIMQAQDATFPGLSFEMLRVATGTDTIFVKSDRAGVKSVGVKGFEVPTDRNGQLWVHFAHQDPKIYISAADVLDGKVTQDDVAQRLMIIGSSATGLNDVKTTPIDRSMPGVEIHAQVLESALTGKLLSHPNWAIGAELLATIVLGIAIIWVAPLFGALPLFGFGTAIVAAVVGTSWGLYAYERILVDFTYPLMSCLMIYLTLVFSSYFREQRQRRQIRSAFSQYMSPALVEQVAQSPEKLKLGGEERELTIMFSDVRGFTTISESYKHDPQGLTALMNRFLTPLTNAILDRKGFIDKYMGDAIMAFWNAPLDDTSHQINACEAALDMLERIDGLNKLREAEAEHGGHVYIPINVGVGLNTGSCVVGNMGSDLRFSYSVLGDSVNLASRLEGQTKEYGFPIIIGSNTALAVKDRFAILELDFIMVKGKKEPEVIYAIAGREDTAQSERFQRLRNLTIEMLACYRSRDWDGALAAIERGRSTDDAHSLESLYDLYQVRIRAFQQNPPPPDWNGAYALLTK